MARYRVERKFSTRSGWYGVLAILCFLAIPGAVFWGGSGASWGYTIGFFITFGLLSWRQGFLSKRLSYITEFGKPIQVIWLHVTIASMLTFSGRYIYRIIIGAFHDYSQVSVFFGATNVIELCMAPMDVLSILLLSMLGGFKKLKDVGKRQRYTVLFAAILIIAGAVALVILAGEFILSKLFPGFADESARILMLIIPVIPCFAVIVFSKPFVIKFGNIKYVPLVNGVALAADLVLAILFIPSLGVKGAVISYNIGTAISALSWLGALAWTFKHSQGSVPETDSFTVNNIK
jgi:O-antigen/teichoic acid export membrane protein